MVTNQGETNPSAPSSLTLALGMAFTAGHAVVLPDLATAKAVLHKVKALTTISAQRLLEEKLDYATAQR